MHLCLLCSALANFVINTRKLKDKFYVDRMKFKNVLNVSSGYFDPILMQHDFVLILA